MSNTDRTGMFVLLGIVTYILGYHFIIGDRFDKRIIDNHVVVCGSILGMRGGKGVNVVYEFSYNGKNYVFNESSPKATLMDYKNGKRSLLIVLEKGDPQNHKILSKDDDFVEFKIRRQDTIGISCE